MKPIHLQLARRVAPIFDCIFNGERNRQHGIPDPNPKHYVTRWMFRGGESNSHHSARCEWARYCSPPCPPRSEIKSIPAGLGDQRATTIILSALHGWGGMIAVRVWRRSLRRKTEHLTPYALNLVQAMAIFHSAIIDAAWMNEDEADTFLAMARPHSNSSAMA